VKITQDVNIESRAVLDDGVAGIVATLSATAQLDAFTKDIYDLALVCVSKTVLVSEWM
jgi:hypothetical protein